jgi:dihydroflavonol-4-reductase
VRTCFVTGGSGFVGRHLVPRLVREFRLRLLVRPGQELAQFRGVPHERVEGRLDDADALRSGVAGADAVVHLAALVSFRPEDRRRMFTVNAAATAQLAALAREHAVRRFLHVSTISAVAYRNGPEMLDEATPFNFGPLCIGYCDSKFAAEHHVREAARAGLDAVIVNPPSMYGAGDRRKGDDSLLGAVLAGRVRVAPPGGLNVANVADVCDGIVRALHRGRTGERYILGGENLTGRQLLERIAAVVGGKAPRRTLPQPLLRATARALALKERTFGSKPPMTSQILTLAGCFQWFSSEKAARELDWRAGPVDDGIRAAWADLQTAD